MVAGRTVVSLVRVLRPRTKMLSEKRNANGSNFLIFAKTAIVYQVRVWHITANPEPARLPIFKFASCSTLLELGVVASLGSADTTGTAEVRRGYSTGLVMNVPTQLM